MIYFNFFPDYAQAHCHAQKDFRFQIWKVPIVNGFPIADFQSANGPAGCTREYEDVLN